MQVEGRKGWREGGRREGGGKGGGKGEKKWGERNFQFIMRDFSQRIHFPFKLYI